MTDLVLGDSIAVGVSWYAPSALTFAEVGINSSNWLAVYLTRLPPAVDRVAISLGTNDGPAIPTLSNLRSLRNRLGFAKVGAPRVTWLLPPIHEKVRAGIQELASRTWDKIIDIRAGDLVGVHPTRAHYRAIAEEIFT